MINTDNAMITLTTFCFLKLRSRCRILDDVQNWDRYWHMRLFFKLMFYNVRNNASQGYVIF